MNLTITDSAKKFILNHDVFLRLEKNIPDNVHLYYHFIIDLLKGARIKYDIIPQYDACEDDEIVALDGGNVSLVFNSFLTHFLYGATIETVVIDGKECLQVNNPNDTIHFITKPGTIQ